MYRLSKNNFSINDLTTKNIDEMSAGIRKKGVKA